ncbi:50S ribosomal protein L29 [Prolixibacter sp. SD074]|jgi:large subunit ribosomal protein L29|uniref:50S ribosomal protein L29 n=1 Tax=Prolixibacter sp. SD074 TaxID=2652391 RepID=UPI001282F871|nr:50S ribosomal protein L29 [Prolixibacter sp. SD074]GET31070.1 50S ribosomal protein L29 [Prolixibacter sp. SD074]
MKTSEISELTTAEIVEKIDNANEELVRMKMNHAVSPLDNPLRIRHTRRDIARLQTELRKRQLEEK